MSRQNELKLAKKQLEEANELEKQKKYKEALELYRQASTLYEKWGQWEDWTKVNNEIGGIFISQLKIHEGIAHFQAVLKIAKMYLNNENPHLLWTLEKLSHCHYLNETYQLAISYLEEQLVVYQKKSMEKARKLGNCLYQIGFCHFYENAYEKAFQYQQNAIVIFEKNFGNKDVGIGKCLNCLAACCVMKGDYELAIDYLKNALDILKSALGEEHVEVGRILLNLGESYMNKGDYSLAILFLQNSLKILKKRLGEGHPHICAALVNMSKYYYLVEDYELAIQYAQETLAIHGKYFGEEHSGSLSALNWLGLCFSEIGDYELSIQYHQTAITIVKKNYGDDHPTMLECLSGLANSYKHKGDYPLAKLFYQDFLALTQKIHGDKHRYVAISLNGLGNCAIANKNFESALRHFHNALIAIVSSFNQKNPFQNPSEVRQYTDKYQLLDALYGKTISLFHLYSHQTQDSTYLQTTLATIKLATKLIIDIRRDYKAEGSKHFLSEKTMKIYNKAIEVALEIATKHSEASPISQNAGLENRPYNTEEAKKLAFNFAEQFKAALLYANLKDDEAKYSSNIPTELLAKERKIKIELNYLENSINTQKAKGDEKDEELLAKFQSQYFEQKQQYDALIEQFETDYPEYYQLKYSISTASVQDLQFYLLGNSPFIPPLKGARRMFGDRGDVIAIQQSNNSTIILSYHIAKEKIYIFAISSNDYQIATVEKPSNFSQLIEKLQEDIQLGYVKEFIQSATQLFDILLRPVWDFLQSVSKLIIIPHGELYYVPFDVLLNQHQITDIKNFINLPYLVRDFDISYHYSATLLLHSHQRQQQTSERVDSFFGLAPVYFGGEKGNKKKEGYVVKSSGKQTERGRRILKSSGNAQAALEDLEETELEVKEVYQLFEEQGKEAIALFYDQANKHNLQEYIGGYKYVLISTHGFLQETGKNTLSGIHLAPPNPKASIASAEHPSNIHKASTASIESDDYILHTSETYHLNLNADLVVLSSCESGVGELKVGEGMMALNRGFLYAGASNIVYSLFRVPQDSTSQLTQALFRYILEGESYGTALRKAKLELIEDEMMEPMDWAGFALVGG